MRTSLVLAVVVSVSFHAPALLAATLHVPASYPTIQAGLSAATGGDTVLVACGHYLEHDIVMKSGVVLRSMSGSANCAVIDATSLGRVMMGTGLDASTVIEGFTFTGGRVTGDWRTAIGGGAYFVDSSPLLRNCTFTGNHADSDGGGMKFLRGAPVFDRCRFMSNWGGTGGGWFGLDAHASFDACEFRGNSSSHGGGLAAAGTSDVRAASCSFTSNTGGDSGGGFYTYDQCTVSLDRCTFDANQAMMAGGAFLSHADAAVSYCLFTRNSGTLASAVQAMGGTVVIDHVTMTANLSNSAAMLAHYAAPMLRNCLVSSNSPGPAFACGTEASFSIACTDAWGNAGGDWVGCAASLAHLEGNFSADPLFCGATNPRLRSDSPCVAPLLDPACGDLVGAYGVGCGTASVATGTEERIRWGALKGLMTIAR